ATLHLRGAGFQPASQRQAGSLPHANHLRDASPRRAREGRWSEARVAKRTAGSVVLSRLPPGGRLHTEECLPLLQIRGGSVLPGASGWPWSVLAFKSPPNALNLLALSDGVERVLDVGNPILVHAERCAEALQGQRLLGGFELRQTHRKSALLLGDLAELLV